MDCAVIVIVQTRLFLDNYFVIIIIAEWFLWVTVQCWPCHSSGGQSPASHCRVPDSIPGQIMWALW
jgi:hypothetical protein